MSNLEHLIYTERRAGIGMSLDGKTPPRTGYGVYSMSEGLLPSGTFRDRTFLENAINMKNGSRLASSLLINSFAYVVPAGGMPMMGYYFQRDGSVDPSNRLASSYIDEWYFGALNCYPMDLFGANIWNAHKKSYTWYAEEAPVPTPYMGKVDTAAISPVSIREEALRFACNGREDTVRKAVWMVLKQMSLPLKERKYLVIRDTEENVRLWIAAILYQLPLQAALKVGFNTNITGLNSPQCNTYYFNKRTSSTIKMLGKNEQDAATERHFQAMIVGIHPKDTTLPTGTNAQANKPYVIIDGPSGTCFPVPAEELDREYFKYMLTQDSVITNFFMDMNEMVNLEPTLKLLDLFDAHQVLQSKQDWNYQSLVQSLSLMAPYFSNTGHAVLLNYVLKYLCCPEGYSIQYAATDAGNQLALMRLLRRGAAIVGKTGAIAELDRAAYLQLQNLVASPRAGSALEMYCSALEAVEKGLSVKLMKDMWRSGLRFLDTVDMNSASDSYVAMLFKLLNSYVRNENSTWNQFWTNPANCRTLDKMAKRVCQSETLTSTVLRMFAGSRDAMNRLLLIGAGSADGPRWLCKQITDTVTLGYLCSLLDSTRADASVIEEMLCYRMKQTGHSSEIQDAYVRYLSRKSSCEKYYTTWFHQLVGGKQNMGLNFAKVNELLTSADTYSADNNLLVRILQNLDNSITFDFDEQNRRLVKLLSQWYQKCRFNANDAELWSFMDSVLEASLKNRNLTMYERCICKNPDCDKFTVRTSFVRSIMCKKFLEAALKDAEDPEVHALVLLLFEFSSKADQTEYLDEWAMQVCDASIKSRGRNNSLAALYGLYHRCCGGGKKINRQCDQILDKSSIKECQLVLEAAIRSVERYLCEIRTDKVADVIVDTVYSDYGSKAADGLDTLFSKTQRAYHSTHKNILGNIGNVLSNIFGGNQDEE